MAQAIWADEFARSVPDIEEDEDEELWHVRMASDDVKVLSTTRLDDLFRLSLVDAETLVWQPGMKNWVPLGVVAELDDDDVAPATVPRPPTPPRPVPPRPVVQPLDPFGLVAAPRPLPVLPKPAAPVAIKYQVPESTRPITISEIYAVERRGAFGRFVLGLALVTGLAVTLYRNDVVRDLAHSAQLDTTYAKLEKALGGPSFGTPQSLRNFSFAAALGVSEEPAAAPLEAVVEAPKAAPAVVAPTPTPTQKAQASSDGSPAVVSLDSLPLEKSKATEDKPTAAGPVEKASTRVERTATRAEKAEPEPEQPAKPRTLKDAIRASVTPNAKFKPAKRKRGNDFDPLNPNL